MAPLVKALQAQPAFDVKICVTTRHRQMLDQVLNLFDIQPDFDLNLMKPGQDLYDTTFAATLAAFYQRIPVGHVEAGLRTGELYSPWPEETNRKLTSALAQWHFAPTTTSRGNLRKEGIAPESIYVTGNTVIDALLQVRKTFAHNPYGDGFACECIVQALLADKSLFPLAPERSGYSNSIVPA